MKQAQTRGKQADSIQTKTAPDLPAETEQEQTEDLDPIRIYNNNIDLLIDELIDSKYNGAPIDSLINDRGFFPMLVNYIYNNYICQLLDNKITDTSHRKKVEYPSIEVLNDLFDVYISLVYKYKFNKRPTMIEFSLFTGVSHETLNKWVNGEFIDNYINNNIGGLTNKNGVEDSKRHLTKSYIDSARKWSKVCESALVDGSGEYVKEIFLLKACHHYKENNIEITVNHKNIVSADALPDLIGLKDSKD